MRRLHHFPVVYVADLDAIEGGAPNSRALSEIAAEPGVELWVDAGLGSPSALAAWDGPGRPVIGTETLAGLSEWRRILARRKDVVLSLDWRGGRFLGPPVLAHAAALWPKRVIVMSLSRVGADTGPDMAKLRAALPRAGARAVFAAGGLRHAGDLARLARAGAAGVLAAGALYGGRLSRRAIVAASKQQRREAFTSLRYVSDTTSGVNRPSASAATSKTSRR